jgi:hypothetical protein
VTAKKVQEIRLDKKETDKQLTVGKGFHDITFVRATKGGGDRGSTVLANINLSGNHLSGIDLAPVAGTLKELWMDGNRLQAFPATIFDCDKLLVLGLKKNRLGGAVPDALRNLKRLQVLDLAHNAFTGDLPAGLGELTKLEDLDLEGNHLSTLHPAMARLTKLTELNLGDNPWEPGLPVDEDGFVEPSSGESNNAFLRRCIAAQHVPGSKEQGSK